MGTMTAPEKQEELASIKTQPVASYWFTYENRGTATLAVDLEIQCVAASRVDPDDAMKWQKISVHNHMIDLSPGSRKTISGSLRWYGDAQLMPRIIAPPQPTALISVEPLGAAAQASLEAGTSLGANSAAGERQDLSGSIARIIRNAATGFRDLRAGPGRKIDDYVVYPAETNLPEALRTEVWLAEAGTESQSYVRSLLVRSVDANTAAATFTRVLLQLKATTKQRVRNLKKLWPPSKCFVNCPIRNRAIRAWIWKRLAPTPCTPITAARPNWLPRLLAKPRSPKPRFCALALYLMKAVCSPTSATRTGRRYPRRLALSVNSFRIKPASPPSFAGSEMQV
jgi:hypothetical protein